MILAGVATILLLAHLLPLAAARLSRQRTGTEGDLFAPVWIVSALGILGIPYLYLVALDPGNLSPELRLTPWIRDFDAAVLQYAGVTVLSLALLLAGVYSPLARSLARRLPTIPARRFTRRRCFRAALVLGIVGTAGYLYFLSRIGGLAFLWMFLYNRTAITAGQGYLTYLYSLSLTVAALLLVYAARQGSSRLQRAAAAVVLLLVAAVLASTGGRSGALHLFVLSIFVIHYGVRRLNRLVTPGTVTLGLLGFALIAVFPLFRTSSSWERYSERPDLVARDALANLSLIAPQVSNFDKGMVMVSYFGPERVWWGRSYVDLLVAPVPRTIFPAKPPVDDGIYFKEIVDGREVAPSRPAREMRPTSWPMGTYTMFLNFWYPGLVAGMFLTGLVVGAAYHYMGRSGYSLHSILIYEFVVMGGFSLSNYGIVQFIMTVMGASLLFWVLFAPKPFLFPARRGAPTGAVPAAS